MSFYLFSKVQVNHTIIWDKFCLYVFFSRHLPSNQTIINPFHPQLFKLSIQVEKVLSPKKVWETSKTFFFKRIKKLSYMKKHQLFYYFLFFYHLFKTLCFPLTLESKGEQKITNTTPQKKTRKSHITVIMPVLKQEQYLQ